MVSAEYKTKNRKNWVKWKNVKLKIMLPAKISSFLDNSSFMDGSLYMNSILAFGI